jgi:hypothetical protein
MADRMEFPNTMKEFIDSFSFKDSEEAYTNGAELVPVFRVEQGFEHYEKQIRTEAINEFAEVLKERLKGMQMVELQGEDVCPCAETGEECPYINQDIGCQYCAREHTIKVVDEIAEKMKAGGKNEH